MEEYFKKVEWNFVNMNSPADLFCHYREDGTVYLEEYDRCRNGHLLLSSFFVDACACEFEAEILDLEAGAAIGLYYGDGCFDHYIMAAVENGVLEIRIPNGVPLGDTFRYDGSKRYYTAASVPFTVKPPFKLGIVSTDAGIAVLCNGRQVIGETEVKVSWKKPFARVLAMAVNDRGDLPKAGVKLGKYHLCGAVKGKRLKGICIDGTGAPLSGVSLHAAGIYGCQGLTDAEGRFDLGFLPEGDYEIIAGAEKRGFGHFCIRHTGKECRWCLDSYWEQDTREAIPQGELFHDSFLSSLNGVWKFSMDPCDVGEREEWFLPGNHIYDQRIRIPGSWLSLRAFGEEFLANDNSLHQASSFRCNWRENGRTAWMQTAFSVEYDGAVRLVLGAVSGIAKLWLDGKELGCIVDFYSPSRFRLGTLKAGKKYTLTVKVEYPFEGKQCCFGKQGFWFTDNPGIWQNVWLETEKEARVSDILLGCYTREEEGISFEGRAELELNPEGMTELIRTPECRAGTERIWFSDWSQEDNGVTRLEIIYRAPEGCVQTELDLGSRMIPVEFDATYGDSYDRKTVYVQDIDSDTGILLKKKSGQLEILRILAGRVSLDYRLRLELEVSEKDSRDDLAEIWMGNLKINNAGVPELQFRIRKKGLKEWGPGDASQYILSVSLENKNGSLGRYWRKIAFRRTGQETMKDGTACVAVNGQPVYLRGVLDQGYNPWGLYTYPSLQKTGPGSVCFDVRAARECGYNMIRMHIKDNEPEWYSFCDQEGILVWDEIPSCFYGTWDNMLWQGLHLRRMKAMARKQNYHPCVVMCSVFNESWGILGDHERSPWAVEAAQEWIRTSARVYRRMAPGILVVDNSGYGKTGETDILDYHSYPVEFDDAFGFFGRLEKQNFPGSFFNCYNQENRELMKIDSVRDLLQRNCRIPLKNTEFTGEDRQKGQPVIISEFVHTNEIERMIRVFRFAGYIRMNLASQENEDTSPFTARRVRRDFGLVHRDMTYSGYSQVNQENFVYMTRPWLTAVQAGEIVQIPVYAGLYDGELINENLSEQRLKLCWRLCGVDFLGQWKEDLESGERNLKLSWRATARLEDIEVKIPVGIKGAWLFSWISKEENVICEHDVQFEVMTEKEQSPEAYYWNPVDVECESFSGYTGEETADNRHIWWASGSGRAAWSLCVPKKYCGRKILRLEMSSCQCLEGTRLTDEEKYASLVRIYVQGKLCREILLPDHPWDKKALFSNGAAAKDGIVSYHRTGKWGYGFRYDIPVVIEEKTEVMIEAENGGCIIYGNRMGRYGCDPMFLDGEYETEENQND